MEVTGKIKRIGNTETFGSSGFRKRELVLTTDEQYPQLLAIEFVQDKCDILDKYKEGQDVMIGINLRGREWINPEGEAKYFNSIQGWGIEAYTGGASVSDGFAKADSINENEPDGLPF